MNVKALVYLDALDEGESNATVEINSSDAIYLSHPGAVTAARSVEH
jgi:hypothetical protein